MEILEGSIMDEENRKLHQTVLANTKHLYETYAADSKLKKDQLRVYFYYNIETLSKSRRDSIW